MRFEVAFKGPVSLHSLGLILAPKGIVRGAVFAGWDLERKSSLGENHEELEVGDRLWRIENVDVANHVTFNEAERILREEVGKFEGKLESALAKEAEDAELVFSKYENPEKASVTMRLKLVFEKPLRPIFVELYESDLADNGNLMKWFQSPDSTSYGLEWRAHGKAPERLKQLLEPGATLISIEDKAVEGVPSGKLLEELKDSVLPIRLRFASVSGKERKFLNDLAKASDLYQQLLGKSFARLCEEDFFNRMKEGDRDFVVQKIEEGFDMISVDSRGYLPLVNASEIPHDDDAAFFIKLFLNEPDVDVNGTDDCGRSSLHHAARVGNAEAVKTLLLAGAEVNILDDAGRTPLMEACCSGSIQVIQSLITAGADPLLRERNTGWAAIHFAAQNDFPGAIETFAGLKNVDIAIKSTSRPWISGMTALDVARVSKSSEAAKLLHELMSKEPLQRVWPIGGLQVVEDDVYVVDQPWRCKLVDYCEIEANNFIVASRRLERFRAEKPEGKHSNEAIQAREQSIVFENAFPGSEVWLGSHQSLDPFWLKLKKINCLLLLEAGDFDLETIEKHFNASNLFVSEKILKDFEAFAENISQFVGFIQKIADSPGHRLLIASALGNENLAVQAAVFCSFRMIVHFESFEDVMRLVSRRCYHFSRSEVSAKMSKLHCKKHNETDSINPRVDLFPAWEQGMRRLEEHVRQRKLKASRKRTTTFLSNFIM